MNEDFFDRLDMYMKIKGLNDNKVTVQSGIPVGSLGKQRKGSRGLSVQTIAKLLHAYSDLNAEWLLTGNGPMLKEAGADPVPIAIKSENPQSGIPLIPIDAMAGFCTGETQIMEYECERYVIPAFREAEFLIPVKGSSMYPKYSSGDIVACKKIPLNDIFFQWNKVYVIDTNQGALIKRVKKGKDNNHILLVSENEKYEPFELRIDQLHAVAIVIGVIRLE